VAKALPQGSTVYCYGFLAGGETLDFASSLLLVKSLTLAPFGVLSPTVTDSDNLKRALPGLQQIIGLPQFKTSLGKTFGFEDATEAVQWQSTDGCKAVLRP
jgi:hypothetical protein